MSTSVTVDFAIDSQSRSAIDAAAYRLIGTATCQIEAVEGRWVCCLDSVSSTSPTPALTSEGLRAHFLNLVTDENLRERIAGKTDRVRDVILALAFGSLASGSQNQSE